MRSLRVRRTFANKRAVRVGGREIRSQRSLRFSAVTLWKLRSALRPPTMTFSYRTVALSPARLLLCIEQLFTSVHSSTRLSPVVDPDKSFPQVANNNIYASETNTRTKNLAAISPFEHRSRFLQRPSAFHHLIIRRESERTTEQQIGIECSINCRSSAPCRTLAAARPQQRSGGIARARSGLAA